MTSTQPLDRNPPAIRHVRHPSRAPTPGQERRPAFHRSRTSESNAISDRATASFVRRSLCAHIQLDGRPAPIDELLPPLTSSNETDLQIYAIIAVVLKEVVQQWYGKITPDHVFVDEIIAIIAHCTRALEQRIHLVDWESLILDELPGVLVTHIQAVRDAEKASRSSDLSPSSQHIYHTLQFHPALSLLYTDLDIDGTVDPIKNEDAWAQMLSQGLLAVLLPIDDFENRCLRALVGEILSEMVIGNVLSKRLSEPAVLLDLVARTLESANTKGNNKIKSVNEKSLGTGLDRSGLLVSEDIATDVTDDRTTTTIGPAKSGMAYASRLSWKIVSTAFLAFTTARSGLLFLASMTGISSRYKTSSTAIHRHETSLFRDESAGEITQPILGMQIWVLVGTLVQLDLRMPWLASLFALMRNIMVNGIAKMGSTDGRLDRYLSHTFHTRMRDSLKVPTILRNLRAAVFPNNTFPKSSPAAGSADTAKPAVTPHSDTDIQALKRRCAGALVTLLPDVVARVYFCPGWSVTQDDPVAERRDSASEDSWRGHAVDSAAVLFDVLGDKYMNKHLVFNLFELILVRLIPELGEKSVTALLAERLGNDRTN